MSDTLNRLNKLSFYVSVIVKLLMVFVAIVTIASLIVSIYIALNPDFVAEVFSPPDTYGSIQAMLIIVIAGGAVGFVILYVVNHLFMNIYRNHTPFMDENVKDLKYLSILVLVEALIVPIVGLTAAYTLDANLDTTLNFNIAFLFMAFLLYIVSLIFRYGTALQKESDETL